MFAYIFFFIFQVSSSKRSPVGLVICFNDALLKILQWEAYCQIIFPKKKKKYELFYLKKPLMQVKPSLRIQNWNPKEAVMNFIWIWWTFFLCFFTIYNIYNYLLTITSMHKFFLAPHLLGPLLLFVKKILISRRIRYKRVIWREKNHVIWFFSNQWIFDGPKKHYFSPRHKEAHQISRRVVYTYLQHMMKYFSYKTL